MYIKRLAQKVLNGEIDFGAFADMADEEVIAELIKLDGIGKWTAEMSEHRSMYSYVRLSIDRCTATYV